MKGAVEMARLATPDESVHADIINDIAALIPSLPKRATPPELARHIYKIIIRRTDQYDLFKAVKARSNELAMSMYPQLKKMVMNAADPLLTAVELAIAGNVIDYAAKNDLDIDAEIDGIMQGTFKPARNDVFHYTEFKAALADAKKILYLGDNAGEIVFDRVLIEELAQTHELVFAVRDRPAMNDALMEDAIYCGIDKIVRVISSGTDTPGTVLKYCSAEFMREYESADLIISKGQGNFEALSDRKENIYFLFKVKCPVIARHINAGLGEIVIKRNIEIKENNLQRT
jgi:uncharacterized protein with ATP-grasp and redox domains